MDTIFEFFQNNKYSDISDAVVEINFQNIRSKFSDDLPRLFAQVVDVIANCDTKALLYDNNTDIYYIIHIDPYFECSIGDSGCSTIYCQFQEFKGECESVAYYQMV